MSRNLYVINRDTNNWNYYFKKMHIFKPVSKSEFWVSCSRPMKSVIFFQTVYLQKENYI